MSDIKKTLHKAWRRVADDPEVRDAALLLLAALAAVVGGVLRRGK